MTDAQLDALLDRLDREARKQPYPPMGLPINGATSQREIYRLLVREWLIDVAPEDSQA